MSEGLKLLQLSGTGDVALAVDGLRGSVKNVLARESHRTRLNNARNQTLNSHAMSANLSVALTTQQFRTLDNGDFITPWARADLRFPSAWER